MPSLKNVTHENGIFCMFKGEPGTRKSTQALSFPGPQYWISTDQKMEALLLPAHAWGIDFDEIDYDDFSMWDDVERKLKGFQSTCKYKTIIVDSITSVGETINSQTIEVKTQEGKGQIVGGIRVNSLDDYKAEASAFRSMMKKLKDIQRYHKINVILIAHVIGTRAKEEVSTTQQSRIIITGGKTISGKIASYCTEVYHFDIKPNIDADKEGTYGLLTVHTGVDFARTSLPLGVRINFMNKPLYATHILPAIQKINAIKPLSKPTNKSKE